MWAIIPRSYTEWNMHTCILIGYDKSVYFQKCSPRWLKKKSRKCSSSNSSNISNNSNSQQRQFITDLVEISSHSPHMIYWFFFFHSLSYSFVHLWVCEYPFSLLHLCFRFTRSWFWFFSDCNHAKKRQKRIQRLQYVVRNLGTCIRERNVRRVQCERTTVELNLTAIYFWLQHIYTNTFDKKRNVFFSPLKWTWMRCKLWVAFVYFLSLPRSCMISISN